MNKLTCILLIVTAVSLSACAALLPAPSPVPSMPAPQPTIPAKTGKLRVASAISPGLGFIPFWIALDTLKQQGYVVETVDYARYDLATAGLAGGEVDIASANHQTAWAASAKGAPIRAVVARLSMMFVLVAKQEIKTCADLQGKSIAYAATASLAAALSAGYLKDRCADARPQVSVIPSSQNRAAALLSGVIDAAVLEEEDALQLERQAPGKFHVLCYFAGEYPLMDYNAFYARNDFAAEHPDIVQDFVRAYVLAVRRVQDPQNLREAIKQYLPDDPTAPANADVYLAHKAWDVNGGLTPERLQYTLTFLSNANLVPSGLEVEQLADSSYLNAVLADIGRK